MRNALRSVFLSALGEIDEKETTIRRQFEGLRIRLEEDLNNLIEELTQLRNCEIKELQEFNCELQVAYEYYALHHHRRHPKHFVVRLLHAEHRCIPRVTY